MTEILNEDAEIDRRTAKGGRVSKELSMTESDRQALEKDYAQTPIASDSEMLRAYAETIKLKEAEIERLKALVKDRMYELEELNELKSLLIHAADALSGGATWQTRDELIRELRKAAG